MTWTVLLVIFYAFIAVGLSEGLRWYSTQTTTFYQLYQGIKFAEQQKHVKPRNLKKKRKPTKPDPVYVKATGYQVRIHFLTSFILLGCYFFVSSQFHSKVVLQLPFEPFRMVRWITQRGIENSSSHHPSDASATCVYLLAMMVFRYIAPWIIEIPTLPGPSLWEQAEQATQQLQWT